MAKPMELRTDRLLLRQWREADRGPFAALNADPRVMEHFPSTRSRAESDATQDRLADHIARHGWGFWAVETLAREEFIGFVGIQSLGSDVMLASGVDSPGVEIGWRLAFAHWGRGYASEAARAALACGFGDLQLDEIVSLTTLDNHRSQDVMQRLLMRPAGEFDHPGLPAGHPLQRHCLYRLARTDWSPQ
ncbi:GNAT family N-acetyltransferase [Microbulbifer sp. YPW16]|uniref:GNAT family N-acetyltransferase n=1 Tax=Microbulbifer sp. YPW16 TaxID=2904242 RepID=UPI001E540154|nr:GNAT family N-acetyltransferase [Microbulbifer sp. YPW16]UHQ54189.1 GNAT family N-acetyltransferase [Microbulbifer sp. YPW16]